MFTQCAKRKWQEARAGLPSNCNYERNVFMWMRIYEERGESEKYGGMGLRVSFLLFSIFSSLFIADITINDFSHHT